MVAPSPRRCCVVAAAAAGGTAAAAAGHVLHDGRCHHLLARERLPAACHLRDIERVEQHTRLDLASLALADHILPGADVADGRVVKHEPLVQLRAEHKRHVVLAVVGDSTGELEGGVFDLSVGTVGAATEHPKRVHLSTCLLVVTDTQRAETTVDLVR